MLAKDKTIYVAGPMSGCPMSNVPAFDRQAARLRASGYTVISPAELDSPEERAAMLASKDGAVAAMNWSHCLARDIIIVTDEADAVCVLPGWEKSRGARLEVFVALLNGKPILEDYNYSEATDQVHVVAMKTVDVVFTIARSFL